MAKRFFAKKHYNTPGHAHELTWSCYRSRHYFADDKACDLFMEALANAKENHQLKIWAYVLMPNHIHMIFWPSHPRYDIAGIQKELIGLIRVHMLGQGKKGLFLILSRFQF